MDKLSKRYGITKTVPLTALPTGQKVPTEGVTANRRYVKGETEPRTVPGLPLPDIRIMYIMSNALYGDIWWGLPLPWVLQPHSSAKSQTDRN